jgi:hypothetical protein
MYSCCKLPSITISAQHAANAKRQAKRSAGPTSNDSKSNFIRDLLSVR